ncbi:hypothetical protein EC957_011461 [Mortierella hygrophila]|uniref:F-box domain-containing protein n=1 Tax=Mortierella hygrophila TaxID=979708 RepID=A0A9P6FGR5_9FUNG|nr:hypothetical protein EC957_011461 [Mortierella hygrophila]
MKADTIFDLPELLDTLGSHLSQKTLYRCIQVSKTWHATFIPHLWRTFTEDPAQRSTWSRDLASAIQIQNNYPQSLDWYKDVYRRHAKYIRHLTVNTPTILDACLVGAFEQLRSELCLEKFSTGSSGTKTAEPASAATAPTDAGGSLMTNLESLDLNLFKSTIDFYFPIRLAEIPIAHSSAFGSTSSFGPTVFGSSLVGVNANNITGDNNSSSTGNANTNSTRVTAATVAPPPPPDTEKAFVKACQRLVLNNPRLRTLSCPYSKLILQGLEGGSNAVLGSLKNLSCVTTDGMIPEGLPPSVTHLKLNSSFGSRLNLYSSASGGPGTTALVHEGLESLEVVRIESGTHFKGLLAQAPSLKTLSINGFVSNFGFGNYFATAAPIPVDISWPSSHITVLKCRQTLGTFSTAFGTMMTFGPPAAGVQLAKHCPFVEVIRINQDASVFLSFGTVPNPRLRTKGWPVNDSVSILLTGLPRLRVLNIPYGSIKAETMLESPWVCLDLEEFWCQIAEVPFLTDEEEQQVQEICQREAGAIGPDQEYIRTDEEDEVMELSEICVSTRKSIFTQLSKLTSLKFLSLSPDFKSGSDLFDNRTNARRVYKSEKDGRSYIRYDDVMPDTLYFRLNHGLDQLASLTKLEYLSFESMDHRMEITDIEWFASHLPRLREMRGLVTENHVGMEPDPKNDALVALMRRLRPEVSQRQSFGGYDTGSQTSDGPFGWFGQPAGAVDSRP